MTISLILDGSETSLKNALLVLKSYDKISGLGVNVDKTSVIWIGSMRNSNRTLCRDYSLHWEKEQIGYHNVYKAPGYCRDELSRKTSHFTFNFQFLVKKDFNTLWKVKR